MNSEVNPLLKRLDQMARQESESDVVPEILAAMEAVVSYPAGLDCLVDRYASSESAPIVRSLSFLLARQASSPTSRSCGLVFALLERLVVSGDASVLINVLTAIHRQAILGCPWPTNSDPPAILSQFIMDCLGQSELVQTTTIDLLNRLREDKILRAALGAGDIAGLRKRLSRMATRNDPLLAPGLQALIEFIENNDCEEHHAD